MNVTPNPADAEVLIKIGLGVIAAIFGGLVFWSLVAPIDSAVVAPGQVVVESNRKAVQHLEGGVVSAIFVREGDEVQQNDVVIHLDDIAQQANLALIDSRLMESYARRSRLEAERNEADEMAYPRGAVAVIGELEFRQALLGQRRLFEARRATRMTQTALLEERVVQQTERIAGYNVQIGSLHEQLKLIADELEGVRELYEQGFASKTRVRELEREAKRLSGERGALRAGVAEAESVIAEARLEIEKLNEVAREEAIAELRDIEASITELEEQRVTAVDALARTRIRAPYSGRVLGLSVHTTGGVIAAGAPLMEIVPVGDRLQIAAHVSPQDIDKVRAGQKTRVRFSAFGASRTPETDGLVKTVSADSLVDEKAGMSYYLVIIEIPEGEILSKLLNGETLAPGMPVETFIRTGSRPAVSYFLKPLLDSMARSMKEE